MYDYSPEIVTKIQNIVESFFNMREHHINNDLISESELQEIYIFYNSAPFELGTELAKLSNNTSTTITPFTIISKGMVEVLSHELYEYMNYVSSPDCLYNEVPLHIAIHKLLCVTYLISRRAQELAERITV